MAFHERTYASTACMSSAAIAPKCGYGISGNSGVPSFETPAVTARCSSPSVHEPIAAGVMFLA